MNIEVTVGALTRQQIRAAIPTRAHEHWSVVWVTPGARLPRPGPPHVTPDTTRGLVGYTDDLRPDWDGEIHVRSLIGRGDLDPGGNMWRQWVKADDVRIISTGEDTLTDGLPDWQRTLRMPHPADPQWGITHDPHGNPVSGDVVPVLVSMSALAAGDAVYAGHGQVGYVRQEHWVNRERGGYVRVYAQATGPSDRQQAAPDRHPQRWVQFVDVDCLTQLRLGPEDSWDSHASVTDLHVSEDLPASVRRACDRLARRDRSLRDNLRSAVDLLSDDFGWCGDAEAWLDSLPGDHAGERDALRDGIRRGLRDAAAQTDRPVRPDEAVALLTSAGLVPHLIEAHEARKWAVGDG